MSKGIFLISANQFFELKDKLIIGKGPSADIILQGELAPQQVKIHIFDNQSLIINLNTSLNVTVGKKILPEGWNLPLSNWALIEIGDLQFIYSEEGEPRPFQIKKVLEEFELVGDSEFDNALKENVIVTGKKVQELTKKIKPLIAEMEKIKNEIGLLIKERDEKAHEYHLKIQEKKVNFEKLKVENTKLMDELKIKRDEIHKILKGAAGTVVKGKLELDK